MPIIESVFGVGYLHNLTGLILSKEYDLVRDVLHRGDEFEMSDEDGWTPLHAAALRNASSLIEPLLKAGCSLAGFNNLGWTPVHIAAGGNNIDFLGEILEPALSCVRSKNEYGSTPLHIAATYGNIESARMLLESGVEPNQRDSSRLTAMNYAVSYEDHPGMVEMLADSGTLVDDADNKLGPPLYGAVELHLYGAAVTLIGLGADTTRTTLDGLSFAGLLNAVGWSGVID